MPETRLGREGAKMLGMFEVKITSFTENYRKDGFSKYLNKFLRAFGRMIGTVYPVIGYRLLNSYVIFMNTS